LHGAHNQPLAALASPLPRYTKAQSWHTQSELVTYVAQDLGTQESHLREGWHWPSDFASPLPHEYYIG
jgi:hypothetical protein